MAAKGLNPVLVIRRIWFDIFVSHIVPSFLLFHNAGMMKFGSNKANGAKNESIQMLNKIHETWDGGMY